MFIKRFIKKFKRFRQFEEDQRRFEQTRWHIQQGLTKGVAQEAAKETIHYFVAYRSLSWWREKIEEAENAHEKYLTLANFITDMKQENEDSNV